MSHPQSSSTLRVALFPGQGSQHVGMAKDFFEQFAPVRELFEEASDAIHTDLKKLCFDGPESDLMLTENTQPALLVSSIAAYLIALRETDFRPQACAGHSLGEYTALVASGALPLATAVQWVRARGAAMQRAVPAGQGTMAAIMGMEDDAIAVLCRKATEQARTSRAPGSDLTVPAVCEPANYNAPGQIVIAGSRDGIEAAISILKTDTELKGKAIPLSVSAPFHCSLMQPARETMARIFKDSGVTPKKPAMAYYPNRTARPSQEEGLIFDLLTEQVDHPVLWKQTVAALMDRGFTQAVEFGPGKVLAGLNKRIEKATGKALPTLNVSDSDGIRGLTAALQGSSS